MGKPEEYKKFRIIPYKTYVNMGYSPELVLLHLQDQKFHNMNEIVEKMKTDLSYATVALPDQNSEKLYFRLITGYLPICIILALIVLVSSISVLYILIDAVRVHIQVFLICGISRKRMLWY